MRGLTRMTLAAVIGALALSAGLGPAVSTVHGQQPTGTPGATATAPPTTAPTSTATAAPTATATTAPTATATGIPLSTATAPPSTATATATAAPATATAPATTATAPAATATAPAATATAPRTATPAPVATTAPARTPTPIPQAQQMMAAPDCPGKYDSGSQQLRPATTTRVSFTCTVTNRFNEPIDYNGTMTFTLAPNVTVVGGGAARGNVSVVGNQIRWSGFTLMPGETATASSDLELIPAQTDVGRAMTVFTGVNTTARVASGGLISISVGPVPSSVVTGLAGGGLVAGVTAQPAPAPAAALPRVGTGAADRSSAWLIVAGALALIAAGGTSIAVRRTRR